MVWLLRLSRFSSSRVLLASRHYQNSAAGPRVVLPTRSSLKEPPAKSPTRHSLKQPPRVCKDVGELHALTQEVLETPVGQLYASKIDGLDRDSAYDVSYETMEQVEYLMRGHAHTIPGSLYYHNGPTTSSNVEESLVSLQGLLERMEAEGAMFMELRHQTISGTQANEEDSSSSSSSDESSSSDDEGEDEAPDSSISRVSEDASGSGKAAAAITRDSTQDFAAPGPTITMYDALLDGMASVGNPNADPKDYHLLAEQALDANLLDQGNNPYTLPTHVTYNAALRGIAACELLEEESRRDHALEAAFDLYNHLTHSLHLPRNSATIIYMLQIVDKVFPPSRVKGNISVSFWQQASQLGIANEEVVKAVHQVHLSPNGPEFDLFLEDIASEDKPQRFRRFVQKYKRSKHY